MTSLIQQQQQQQELAHSIHSVAIEKTHDFHAGIATTLHAAPADYGLPAGVTVAQALSILLVMGLVTVALRALGFVAKKRMRHSPMLAMLERTMPVGVLVIVVVFILAGYAEEDLSKLAAGIVCVLITLALQVKWGNYMVSIFVGTLCYIAAVNFLLV